MSVIEFHIRHAKIWNNAIILTIFFVCLENNVTFRKKKTQACHLGEYVMALLLAF